MKMMTKILAWFRMIFPGLVFGVARTQKSNKMESSDAEYVEPKRTTEKTMSDVIGKGEDAQFALMAEVEAMFDMTVVQRSKVEYQSMIATSPGEEDWTYQKFYDEVLSDLVISGQPLESEHYLDADENPDGGFTEGTGLSIRWQRGALDFDGDGVPWNGCFLVTLLEAATEQLEFYQSTKFKGTDNAEAMAKVQEVIDILNRRQVSRFTRGVRGKHEE